MEHLGFPIYVMRIRVTWYVGAAVSLIVSGLPLAKERPMLASSSP